MSCFVQHGALHSIAKYWMNIVRNVTVGISKCSNSEFPIFLVQSSWKTSNFKCLQFWKYKSNFNNSNLVELRRLRSFLLWIYMNVGEGQMKNPNFSGSLNMEWPSNKSITSIVVAFWLDLTEFLSMMGINIHSETFHYGWCMLFALSFVTVFCVLGHLRMEQTS